MESFNDLLDQIEVIDIPIDEINKNSIDLAEQMVKDLIGDRFDEEFFKNNLPIANRLDTEVDALRLLIKMRAANELAHDMAIKSVGQNSGNASMYKSLTTIQNQTQSIIKQIDEKRRDIINMMTSVQLEMNFEKDSNDKEADTSNVYRGSKDFIENMKNN